MVKKPKQPSPLPPLHFFKVVLPSAMETKILRIPPKFVKNYRPELSGIVTLSNPSGREWLVRLKKDKTGVWFGDSWFEFVEYHSIREGYFLVFQYQRKSRFEVRIFDLTACEIDYPCSVLEINDDDEIRYETNGNYRWSSKRNSVARRSDSSLVRRNADNVKISIEETEEVIEVTESCNSDVSLRKKRNWSGNMDLTSVRGKHQLKKGKFENARDRGVTEVLEVGEKGNEIFVSQRSSTRIESEEILVRKAEKLKLKHPLFMVILKHHNFASSNVYIPIQFARTYLKNPPKFINIQDPEERNWHVVVNVESRSYLRLSKGWRKMSDANHLKVGNICVFKPIKMNGNTGLKLFVIRS